MVHFKVTDGSQTRRLEAPSGLTYDGLKKKLSSLFPDAVKEDSHLVLRYRDADRDVITLSSDQELQEVLSTAGEDLKFFLPKSVTSGNPQKRNGVSSSFPSHWSPFWDFSATTAGDRFEKEVQEFAELLEILTGSKKSSSSDSTPRNKEASQESEASNTPVAKTEGADSSSLEAESDEEVRPKPTSEATSSAEGVESSKSASSEDEEVKSKPDSKAAPTEQRNRSPGYIVHGGLAPLLLSDILFHRPAPRRVGYHITWSPYGLRCAC